MPRTTTHHLDRLFIPWGGIEFAPKAAATSVVTITFRTGDNIPGTGLHWHENHTEYLEVLEGCALVTLGGNTAVFTKDDGVITIPRYTIHQYMRADKTEEGKIGRDKDLVVREWTEPADGDKEIFFRNVLSLLIDRKDSLIGNVSMLFSIMAVAWAHDNYPVFWKGPSFFGRQAQKWVMRTVTYSLIGSITLVGRLLGFKPDYPEYSPTE